MSGVVVLFDLDNVLVHKEHGPVRGVDRTIFEGHKLSDRTYVYLRPNLREFFERVRELSQGAVKFGVWSSMQPNNVQLITQLLNRVLAPAVFEVVLDRTSCTPAPTSHNRYATRKLFSALPRYVDTTRFLLVDNDADKMLGNAPEQCLVAPPFDVRAIMHDSEVDRRSSCTSFQRMWANVDHALMQQFARDVVERAAQISQHSQP